MRTRNAANSATLPESLADALGDAMGVVLADVEREWRREVDRIAAEARATVADLRADVATLTAALRERASTEDGRVTEALARVRNGEDGASVTADDVAPLVARAVADAVAALPRPKDGEPGRGVSIADVEPLIRDTVAQAVAALPAPRNGEDGRPGRDGMDAVLPDIAAMVREEVAKLPAPKDGEPGRPGEPGRDAVLPDIGAMVAAAVAAEVAKIPPAKDGNPGRDGAPGKLPVARAWTDAVHYEGDVVTHDGATWQATRDTGREPPHEDWICLAGPGRPGADARSPEVRGTWSAAETYQRLDVVALNGASFIARRDNPGACPGEGWQLLATQGKAGRPGESGRPGLRGDPGPPVAAMEIDGEGMLTLRNADGSVVRCDLYPVLSKLK